MGEKLKVIDTINLKDTAFDIELNAGSARSKKPFYIHIQNNRFRLALPDTEFIQMAVAIRSAAEKIKTYKKIDAERLVDDYRKRNFIQKNK